MNADQIREQLAPKAMEIDRADQQAFTAYKMRPRLRPKSAIVRERRIIATEELNAEAVKLGITATWIGWLIAKWVIGQLVSAIIRRWIDGTSANSPGLCPCGKNCSPTDTR